MGLSKEKILDDMARLAGGAMGAASTLSRSIKEEIKNRVDQMAEKMDLVSREEFEELQDMVKKLRKEQEELKKHIKPAKKPAAKKTATKKK